MKKILFILLLSAPAPLLAGFTIRLKTPAREVPVEAELHEGGIALDLVQAAEGLGAATSIKDGEYVLVFASGTAVVNPDSAVYRVQALGERKWRGAGLQVRPYFSGSRLMVAMESLPILSFRTFTYHLQKRELTEDVVSARAGLSADKRAVPARHVFSNQKEWVSLDDAAKGLGVVLYSAQAKSYNLVLPDFTILEATVGDPWIRRKKERYKPLEDPILLFSGAPYATLSSLSALFGAEISWDAASGSLVVPVRYGRAESFKAPPRKSLTIVGYTARPLNVSVDEMALYYQSPGPTYAADQPEVYESVRNFLTNEPLDPGTHGYDRMSGDAVLNLDGSLLGHPLAGGGRFEKVGTRGRLANGSFQWGFPGFQAKAARDYLNLGNLSGQFSLVDNVTVSHANDLYGDGKPNPYWQVKALYGQHLFSVFVSTDILSQTVDFRQTIVGGSLDGVWKPVPGQSLSASLAQYRFLNRVRQVSQEYNFTGDPFLDDLLVQVGQGASKALTSTALTNRHDASILDLSYKVDNRFKLDGDGGLSRYRDPATGKPVLGGDWRAAGTLGERRSRMTASYEKAGPEYRSIGSPLIYQNKSITRLSPYLDLARFWKVYGEFRREDSHGNEAFSLTPYRSDFAYMSNVFNLPKLDVRLMGSKSDHTLFGKSWSGDLDATNNLGRDSVNVGGAWASQWYGVGGLFRQAYKGRLGYQRLRPDWKLSAGEELGLNHYPKETTTPPSRWQSATHVLGQRKSWEAFLQYAFEPRYFNETQVIYTGYARVGYQVGTKKIFNLFYAATSLDKDLKHPQVWRTGIEYVNDFF